MPGLFKGLPTSLPTMACVFLGTLGLYSCREMERQKSLEHLEGRWLALLPLAVL